MKLSLPLFVIIASSLQAALLPGDMNGDWKVDSGDYVSARKSSTSLTAWRANFGKSAATIGVTVPAGADIQSIVNANPINTIFYLASGIDRLTTQITPKDGDAFVSDSAVLNGSKLLTSFTASSGRWYATDQTSQISAHGTCQTGFAQCSHPEDVFIDDKPLLHVGSLAEVAAGKWYFDYSADRIYLGDNPAGHKVETSIAERAFRGTASNVTIYGLTVEKFATQSQDSAIQVEGTGWLINHDKVQLNHASGIQAGSNGIVRDTAINTNGQEGIVTNFAHDVLIETSEIAFNNFAHYSNGWESGGSKFWSTANLTARANIVHDNLGGGLWTDTNNTNTIYDSNIIYNNLGQGIRHEISGSATIKNNRLTNNCITCNGGDTAQITVYSSQNTEAAYNYVESTQPGENAILFVQDTQSITGDFAHHNTIISRIAGADNGMTGIAGTTSFAGRFDYDTYYVPDPSARHWQWSPDKTWSEFRAIGNEAHGQLFTLSSPAAIPEPVCMWRPLLLFILFHRRRVSC